MRLLAFLLISAFLNYSSEHQTQSAQIEKLLEGRWTSCPRSSSESWWFIQKSNTNSDCRDNYGLYVEYRTKKGGYEEKFPFCIESIQNIDSKNIRAVIVRYYSFNEYRYDIEIRQNTSCQICIDNYNYKRGKSNYRNCFNKK